MGTPNSAREPIKIGNFEIVEEIGQGGMGVIYLARQPALERLVVLKKIRREINKHLQTIEKERIAILEAILEVSEQRLAETRDSRHRFDGDN